MTAITQQARFPTVTPSIWKEVFRRAPEAYMAFYFVFVSGAIDLLLYGGGGGGGFENRGAGTLVVQVLGTAAAMPAILFCFLHIAKTQRTALRGWKYLLLIALATASLLWSVDTGVSTRRLVALILNLPIAIYFAFSIGRERALKALGLTSVLLCVLCIVAVVMPGGGVVTGGGKHAGAFQGVFPNKTASGLFFGLATILFWANLCHVRKGSRWRLFWLVNMVMGFALLILSDSRTPLLATVFAGGVIWLALFVFAPRGWQKRLQTSLRGGLALSGIMLGALSLPIAVSIVLFVIGRDLTLTGRWNLWKYAITKGWNQPWLGAGLKAFWTDALTIDLLVVHASWGDTLSVKSMTANAHNGYIDVWLELGFVGLAVFFFFWTSFGLKAVRRLRRDGIGAAWYLGLWAFMSCYYLANSTVFEHDEISWFLIVLAYFSLCAQEVGLPYGARNALVASRSRAGSSPFTR